MIFGKGECGRTRRTSNENLTKSTKIAAFWQGSFYSCLACVSKSANLNGLFERLNDGSQADLDISYKIIECHWAD